MPIEPPVLDDLRFDRVVEELKRRIPVYAPEWTNHNDADPGIALVQLFAYLTEQIGYRLNRVPEKNHVALLQLLGVRLRPARPARAKVGFFLADPVVLPGFTIDAASRVTRRAGAPPPLYETDEALDVVPAEPVLLLSTKNPYLGDLLRLDEVGHREPAPLDSELPPKVPAADSRWLTVGWDGKQPKAPEWPLTPVRLLAPSATGVPHPYLWVGLAFNAARDAGFLGVTVTLHVQLDDDEQPDPTRVERCAPVVAAGEPAPAPIDWLAYSDSSSGMIKRLPGRIDDSTERLTRSGTIRFTVPFELGALPPEAFVELRKAVTPTPVDACSEIATGLSAALGTPEEETVPFRAAQFQQALAKAVADSQAASASAKPAVPHPLDPKLRDPARVKGWLRIGPLDPSTQAKLRYLGFNAVGVTHTVSVRNELLGVSDGRPGQVFRLAHRNVVASSLEVGIAESAEPTALLTTWRRVEELEATGPDDRVFELDAEAGVLTFGDGLHGRVPPLVPRAGAVIALGYRHGGGKEGESAPGTLTISTVQNAGLRGVVNFTSAVGGADAETLEGAKLRARKELSTRSRAVTSGDFEWLALQTPEVRVRRAITVPRRRPLPSPLTAAAQAQLQQAQLQKKELRYAQPAQLLSQAASVQVLQQQSYTTPMAGYRLQAQRATQGATLDRQQACSPVKTAPVPTGSCGPPLPLPPSGLDESFEAPGVVSVVVVPDTPGFEPLPTPSFLRAVCRHLDEHRLVTTEVYVVPPQYFRLCNVFVKVKGRPGYTRARLQELVIAALSTSLDVLHGGEDGTGAPFGGQVHVADLIARVLRTEGIERVQDFAANFVRTKSNAQPRQGRLLLCPTVPEDFDHVDLAAEETTSLDTSSFTLSLV
jgi:predicted phage baseplate assembly protein